MAISLLDVGKALGSVAQVLDDITPDAGDLVEMVADTVLPDELEIVGDVLAIGADLYTGNYLALIGDGVDLAEGMPATEPDPPPPPTSQPDAPAGASDDNDRGADTSGSLSRSRAPLAPVPQEEAGRSAESTGQEAARAFLERFGNAEAFTDAIRHGQIPEEVLNSRAGMMMIQERLQQIQQMNQLMTQMLQATHEMQMAVIRNVRA